MEAFLECLPPAWQVPLGGACRYIIGGRQMRSIFGMPSDDLAGAAKRCVPLHYYIRRKANAKHFWNAFRRLGRCREAVRAVTLLY